MSRTALSCFFAYTAHSGLADVAQLVERNLAKVEVAGSIPVVRSRNPRFGEGFFASWRRVTLGRGTHLMSTALASIHTVPARYEFLNRWWTHDDSGTARGRPRVLSPGEVNELVDANTAALRTIAELAEQPHDIGTALLR